MKKKLLIGALVGTLALGGLYFNNEVIAADSTNIKTNVVQNLNRGLNCCNYDNIGVRNNMGYLAKGEFDNLTKEEQNILKNRVKEYRNITDEEALKLLKSGDYCIGHNLTRAEYDKLSETEKSELRNYRGNCGYGINRNRMNGISHRNNQYNNTNRRYQGRGICHR